MSGSTPSGRLAPRELLTRGASGVPLGDLDGRPGAAVSSRNTCSEPAFAAFRPGRGARLRPRGQRQLAEGDNDRSRCDLPAWFVDPPVRLPTKHAQMLSTGGHHAE